MVLSRLSSEDRMSVGILYFNLPGKQFSKQRKIALPKKFKEVT